MKAEAEVGHTPDGRPWVRVTAPMPPSDNNLYFIHKKRKVMTTEGKRYRNIVHAAIGKCALKGRVVFDPNLYHAARLEVFFEKVETKGWFQFFKRGKKAGQRKAERRFYKTDTDNRRKLITDSVCEAIGIDDCCLSPKRDEKGEDPSNPRLIITIVERSDQKTRRS